MDFLQSLSKKQLYGLIAILIIIVTIPLTVYIAQQRQELRQHAGSDFTLFFADCTTNPTNSTQLSSPWTIITGTQPILCLYLQANDSSLNLRGIDIQITYDQGLNLNSITIQNGGEEFNNQEIKTFNNSTHSFEIERTNTNLTKIISGNLLITTLNFALQTGVSSGTINFTNPSASVIAAGKQGYLVGGYTPITYTVGGQTPTITPTTTPASNPLDINLDGCVGNGDIKTWEYAYESPGQQCANTNSADVNKDGAIDLRDYNLIFNHMLNGASDLCQNTSVPAACPYKQ